MPIFPLEAGLTASLWDLFSSEGPSEIALEVLLRQLPAEDPRVKHFQAQTAQGGTQAWWPRRTPGADFGLVTSDDDRGVAGILAVVEVKSGAATNWPYMPARLEGLPGPVAESIRASYRRDSDDIRVCQADLYRAWKWWKDADGVELKEPDMALWLLFDARGREPRVAFEGASNPEAWLTVDLKRFARDLRESRTRPELTQQHQDSIAVVLWHVSQAPANRSREAEVTSPAVGERPPLSDIGVDG